MKDVIEHVRTELLKTKVGTGTNGANNLGTMVSAYVTLLHTAAALEAQQAQLMMEAAERGFTEAPDREPTPPTLVVAR